MGGISRNRNQKPAATASGRGVGGLFGSLDREGSCVFQAMARLFASEGDLKKSSVKSVSLHQFAFALMEWNEIVLPWDTCVCK